MSVSISYTQLTKNYLQGVTSRTAGALTEVFGEAPWRLGLGQLDQLRAMAAVHGRGMNPYTQLADIIEQFAVDLLVTPEH
jgi:hypothetical protein